MPDLGSRHGLDRRLPVPATQNISKARRKPWNYVEKIITTGKLVYLVLEREVMGHCTVVANGSTRDGVGRKGLMRMSANLWDFCVEFLIPTLPGGGSTV